MKKLICVLAIFMLAGCGGGESGRSRFETTLKKFLQPSGLVKRAVNSQNIDNVMKSNQANENSYDSFGGQMFGDPWAGDGYYGYLTAALKLVPQQYDEYGNPIDGYDEYGDPMGGDMGGDMGGGGDDCASMKSQMGQLSQYGCSVNISDDCYRGEVTCDVSKMSEGQGTGEFYFAWEVMEGKSKFVMSFEGSFSGQQIKFAEMYTEDPEYGSVEWYSETFNGEEILFGYTAKDSMEKFVIKGADGVLECSLDYGTCKGGCKGDAGLAGMGFGYQVDVMGGLEFCQGLQTENYSDEWGDLSDEWSSYDGYSGEDWGYGIDDYTGGYDDTTDGNTDITTGGMTCADVCSMAPAPADLLECLGGMMYSYGYDIYDPVCNNETNNNPQGCLACYQAIGASDADCDSAYNACSYGF